MRSVPVCIIAAGVIAAGCGNADGFESAPTLPPIQTTSTTTTVAPAQTTLPEYYQVQRGDTLTDIAAAYEVPVQALMDANELENPDGLFAGQFLAIPRREDIVAVSLPTTVPGQTPPPMPTVGPDAPPPTTSDG